MFEIIKADGEVLTIKNNRTGETMSFKTWYEFDKFMELAKQYDSTLIPF